MALQEGNEEQMEVWQSGKVMLQADHSERDRGSPSY